MEVKGKIEKIMEVQSGTSKEGKEWKKLQFTLRTEAEYNNLYCFDVFGAEKVDKFTTYNKAGNLVDVSFNVKTNEWKDKFYTSLDAWKVFKADSEQTEDPEEETSSEDDLPF
jgi:hypothetical protein